MAWLDDVTKNMSSPSGLVVGLGALVLTPVLLPALSRLARPAAKAAVAAGIGGYRRIAEPIGQTLTELVAEARQELEASDAARTRPEQPAGAHHGDRAKQHRSKDEGSKDEGSETKTP